VVGHIKLAGPPLGSKGDSTYAGDRQRRRRLRAGMEGALPSVVAGLNDKPVIAVTSAASCLRASCSG